MQFLRRYDLVESFDDEPRELLGQDPARYWSAIPRPTVATPLPSWPTLAAQRRKSTTIRVGIRSISALRSRTRIATCSIRASRSTAIRTIRSSAKPATCTTAPWKARFGWSRRRARCVPARRIRSNWPAQSWDVTVAVRSGPWREDEFDRFEFVSDYEIKGLQNHYHTYGLGVPLIAVRKNVNQPQPAERYFPPVVSFPMTAFLRLLPDETGHDGGRGVRHRAVLELYDPLTSPDIVVSDRRVPLETDLSTPLAYILNDPAAGQDRPLDRAASCVRRKPSSSRAFTCSSRMIPRKIPVLFVHGLWSSPITWMEMFNDLAGTPDAARALPVLVLSVSHAVSRSGSAPRGMRDDLVEMRAHGRSASAITPALDQMVLVGHSMGGLVSRMQTIDSGNDFWNIVSDKPFHLVKAEPPGPRRPREVCSSFEPNPSIRRVVTIGTPHRGSSFANDTTRWVGTS